MLPNTQRPEAAHHKQLSILLIRQRYGPQW